MTQEKLSISEEECLTGTAAGEEPPFGENSYRYFSNRACAYYPCHQGTGEKFNCLFCYCPLYALGSRCGGNFRYTDTGMKDCSACLIPHGPAGYDYILSRFREVAELAGEKRPKEPSIEETHR